VLLLDNTSRSPLQGTVVAVSGLDHLDHEDLEFLDEVHRVVTRVIEQAGGSVPPAGSDRWRTAPDPAKVASLLVLAEAYLVSDPHQIAAEMIKEASVAVSSSGRWSAASARPSHAEVMRRRAEPGPLAALVFDPVAAARWVETGISSEERAA
jgi:hypothetical protein